MKNALEAQYAHRRLPRHFLFPAADDAAQMNKKPWSCPEEMPDELRAKYTQDGQIGTISPLLLHSRLTFLQFALRCYETAFSYIPP
jgi:hypothetical protein